MSRTPLDWEELLRDFLVGDARAARAAADLFCGVMRGTLRALGAYERRSGWEDLMHDVLLKLFEHGHAVQSPVAWVRCATRNAYVDWVRKEASQSSRVHELGIAQALRGHEADTALDASVALKEELEELRGAVSRLPEGLRCIVDSVYPRDPGCELGSLTDVAHALGLELHTVKNRLRSAVAHLGRELRRERNLRRFRLPVPAQASTQRARPPRPPRSKGRRLVLLARRERHPRAEE
jgi:DNA-directed RNA polymerase specialized sigma24 family protein